MSINNLVNCVAWIVADMMNTVRDSPYTFGSNSQYKPNIGHLHFNSKHDLGQNLDDLFTAF